MSISLESDSFPGCKHYLIAIISIPELFRNKNHHNRHYLPETKSIAYINCVDGRFIIPSVIVKLNSSECNVHTLFINEKILLDTHERLKKFGCFLDTHYSRMYWEQHLT